QGVGNMYGATEATGAATSVQITEAMVATGRPLTVGHPPPEIEKWIADPDDPRRRLPDGARGEIVIAGPQIADPYLRPSDAGEPADRSSPFFTLPEGRRAYRTGDLGSVDPADGSLAGAGRLGHPIKLHGYRLELEEIEARRRARPGVSDRAVRADHPAGAP